MARIHGKNTVITIDGTDMSSFIDDSTFSQSGDVHDTTAYGQDNRSYIGGLIDGTFSISGHYDDGTDNPRDAIPALLGGAAVTIVRSPEGTGTGLAQDSFSAICTSYDESSPVDDKISFSADFQITGAITITDQA